MDWEIAGVLNVQRCKTPIHLIMKHNSLFILYLDMVCRYLHIFNNVLGTIKHSYG